MGTHCGSGGSTPWAVGAEWAASPGKRPCSGEEYEEESAPHKRSRSAGELALLSAEGEVVHAPAPLREFFPDRAGAMPATVRGEVLRHLVGCLQASSPSPTISPCESVADNVELLAAAEVHFPQPQYHRGVLCRLPQRVFAFSPVLFLTRAPTRRILAGARHPFFCVPASQAAGSAPGLGACCPDRTEPAHASRTAKIERLRARTNCADLDDVLLICILQPWRLQGTLYRSQ